MYMVSPNKDYKKKISIAVECIIIMCTIQVWVADM